MPVSTGREIACRNCLHELVVSRKSVMNRGKSKLCSFPIKEVYWLELITLWMCFWLCYLGFWIVDLIIFAVCHSQVTVRGKVDTHLIYGFSISKELFFNVFYHILSKVTQLWAVGCCVAISAKVRLFGHVFTDNHSSTGANSLNDVLLLKRDHSAWLAPHSLQVPKSEFPVFAK